MTWDFVAGFACGAVLFDAMWRLLFHKLSNMYRRQKEHAEFLREELSRDQ